MQSPAPDAVIELTIEPRERPVGNGTVHRLLPYRERRMVGPFIFVDRMGPKSMAADERLDIDAHPHIGLSTVSYLFAGRMVHRDSTGAVATIEPGDVNWMTAGAGVCHTERSPDREGRGDRPDDSPDGGPGAEHARTHDGLQTWVALPVESESGPAGFQGAGRGELPEDQRGDSRVRLLVGAGWGLTSPIPGSSPLVYADLTLGETPMPMHADVAELAVAPIDADAFVDGHRIRAGDLAVLARGSRPTITGTGRVMVLGGDPVGPRHIWWNFVHSDRDAIEAAKDDWANQRFPLVPDDHDPWIPAP